MHRATRLGLIVGVWTVARLMWTPSNILQWLDSLSSDSEPKPARNESTSRSPGSDEKAPEEGCGGMRDSDLDRDLRSVLKSFPVLWLESLGF